MRWILNIEYIFIHNANIHSSFTFRFCFYIGIFHENCKQFAKLLYLIEISLIFNYFYAFPIRIKNTERNYRKSMWNRTSILFQNQKLFNFSRWALFSINTVHQMNANSTDWSIDDIVVDPRIREIKAYVLGFMLNTMDW